MTTAPAPKKKEDPLLSNLYGASAAKTLQGHSDRIANHINDLVSAGENIPKELADPLYIARLATGISALDYKKKENGTIELIPHQPHQRNYEGALFHLAQLEYDTRFYKRPTEPNKIKKILHNISPVLFLAAIGFGGIFAGKGATGNVVGTDATLSLLGFGVMLLGIIGLVVVAWKK
jgi:hypothetical protein